LIGLSYFGVNYDHIIDDWPYTEQRIRQMHLITKKYGGRPHWGKIHFDTEADLRKNYPRIEDFEKLRKRLDPNGVFYNAFTEQLTQHNRPGPPILNQLFKSTNSKVGAFEFDTAKNI